MEEGIRAICVRNVAGALTEDEEYFVQQHPNINNFYTFRDNYNNWRSVMKEDFITYFRELIEE